METKETISVLAEKLDKLIDEVNTMNKELIELKKNQSYNIDIYGNKCI